MSKGRAGRFVIVTVSLVFFFLVDLGKSIPTGLTEEPSSSGQTSSEKKEDQEVHEAGSEEPSQEAPGPEEPLPVVEVKVRGNLIINTTTILNKIRTKAGSKLVQETVNEDIKRLYGTGFFQDIKVEVVELKEGLQVIFVVDEKPIVRQVIIEGAQIFTVQKLRKELNLIEGQILDEKLVKDGVQAMKKKYLNKGYRFVDVKSDVDINEQTKEAVVYVLINEGQRYKIKRIVFEGVTSLKLTQVKKRVKTKRDTLFTSGFFKEEKFKEDLERVEAFYQDNGFLDVKVVPEFEYDEKEKRMVIKIRVDEGGRYQTGEVKIEGNLLFPQSEIWQALQMLPGQVYSQKALLDEVEAIRNYYFERGYISAQVAPETKLNSDTGKVDVLYRITEGDLFFVEKVKIRGNTKTKDIVIRRELRIRPGDRFDGAKLDRSKERLESLGFFEEVLYDTEPGSEPNKRNVIYRVKEKQTGELSFGVGISSVDQFLGFAELAQNNFDLLNFPRFTGRGQNFSLRGRVGTVSRDFDLSFVEPYLFNRPVSFGLDAYDTRRLKNNTDFDEERIGASTSFSKAFGEFVRSGFGYTLEQVKLDEISDDASPQVRKFEGDTLLSRARFFASRDSRNNPFAPIRGSLISFSSEMVGGFIGGEEDYYILQLNLLKYWNFRKRHVIETKLRLGFSDEFGGSDTVPVFDRFYAGGLGTVRGYNVKRVGPIEGGDAVGGQSLVLFNVEYNWPLLDFMKGAIFLDVGHVNAKSYDVEFGKFAMSTGPGVLVNTPIGPFALYYGLPFANKDDKDENGRFEFSFSRGF